MNSLKSSCIIANKKPKLFQFPNLPHQLPHQDFTPTLPLQLLLTHHLPHLTHHNNTYTRTTLPTLRTTGELWLESGPRTRLLHRRNLRGRVDRQCRPKCTRGTGRTRGSGQRCRWRSLWQPGGHVWLQGLLLVKIDNRSDSIHGRYDNLVGYHIDGKLFFKK